MLEPQPSFIIPIMPMTDKPCIMQNRVARERSKTESRNNENREQRCPVVYELNKKFSK